MLLYPTPTPTKAHLPSCYGSHSCSFPLSIQSSSGLSYMKTHTLNKLSTPHTPFSSQPLSLFLHGRSSRKSSRPPHLLLTPQSDTIWIYSCETTVMSYRPCTDSSFLNMLVFINLHIQSLCLRCTPHYPHFIPQLSFPSLCLENPFLFLKLK